MTEQERYEQRYIQMTQTPMANLIPKLAVPTIISMLVTSIYNMADTFFVSQINTSASAAVGIIFSLMAMVQTIGFTFGMGSGNYISRALGRKDREQAEKILSTGFFSVLIIGAFISFLGLTFIDDLVYFLGATETIAPYAKDYAKYILYATPFMASSFVMNNTLRAQGNAFYSMLGITAGGILNMVLDPIFIFTFDLGIAGAAIATGVSQLFSFCILFYQCNGRHDTMNIQIKKFTPTPTMYGHIIKAGFPTFCRQGLASVASIVLNIAARPYGDVAIAALSIVNRFMMFINSALIGFGQGFQPVSGFNYGAKRYDRVLEAFWFCVKVALVLTTILGTLGFIFAKNIVTAFRREDLEVISIGTLMLRLQCLMLPVQSCTTMANMLAQSIGYSFRATLIAMSRQGFFYIPILLILPNFLGILGIQIAQPLSDFCTFILSLIIITTVLKDLNRLKRDFNTEPAEGLA